MTESQCILRLFSNVCDLEVFKHQIGIKEIKECIEDMRKTYEPRAKCLTSSDRFSANYATTAHRCAYLHKYAPFHTALTCFVLRTAFIAKKHVFEKLIKNSYGNFHVCSLGGGPGTDVIAMTALVHEFFGPSVAVFANVLDSMPEWHRTFSALHNELQTGEYGHLSHFFGGCWEWRYFGVNLLDMKEDNDITDAISGADMVTMVKFVSAAACVDTSAMVQKIFGMMKPGALVLYIDNDAKIFDDLVTEAADKFNFKPIYGPLKHFHYTNELFNVKKFGYTACFETKVNVHILQKPFQDSHNTVYKKYLTPHKVETSTPIRGRKRKAGCFGETNVVKRLKSCLKETKQFLTKTKKKFCERREIFPKWKIPKKKQPLLSLHSNQLLNNQRNTFYCHDVPKKISFYENAFQDNRNYGQHYSERNCPEQDSDYRFLSYGGHSNQNISHTFTRDYINVNTQDSGYRFLSHPSHSNRNISRTFAPEYMNVNGQDFSPERLDSFHEESFKENLDLSISRWSGRNDFECEGDQESYPERFNSFHEHSFKENLDLSNSRRFEGNDFEDVQDCYPERFSSFHDESFNGNADLSMSQMSGRNDFEFEDVRRKNWDTSLSPLPERNNSFHTVALRENLNFPVSPLSPSFHQY